MNAQDSRVGGAIFIGLGLASLMAGGMLLARADALDEADLELEALKSAIDEDEDVPIIAAMARAQMVCDEHVVCDNCGDDNPEFWYTSAPFATTSTTAGESAGVCKACEDALNPEHIVSPANSGVQALAF